LSGGSCVENYISWFGCSQCPNWVTFIPWGWTLYTKCKSVDGTAASAGYSSCTNWLLCDTNPICNIQWCSNFQLCVFYYNPNIGTSYSWTITGTHQ
jgi:hypothetical protein